MSREQPRSAAASLAGPLELVPDQTGALRGSWRGSSYEVDAESGRLRVRAAVGYLSARFVQRTGRAPKLEVDPEEPSFVEAFLDCLEGSEVRAWLAQPGSRLQVGWLEQPLPGDLDQARKAIEGLIRLAPELARLVKEAEQLARERFALLATAAERQRLGEKLIAEEHDVVRVDERKEWARWLGQGVSAAGLITCVGAMLMVGSGHLSFDDMAQLFVPGFLAFVGGKGLAQLLRR
jgi:hypothetical protein